MTYEELCSEFIEENIELINEENKLIKSISNEKELSYERLKVSIEYKELIDKFINQLDMSIIPNKSINVKEHEIIPNSLIKEIYNSIHTNEIYNTIHKKMQRTKLLIEKYIEDNFDIIKNKLEKENYEDKNLRKNIGEAVKKYFKNIIPKPLKIYENFLKELKDKNIKLDTKILEKIKENIQNLKNRKVEFEDLSALIYIKCKVIGNENYKEFRQVAIDEAQDLGNFSFLALKELLSNATFSIFEDIAQSVYQYRGVSSWNEVIENTFNNKCELKYLMKSYRTTSEIMNSANNVIKHIGMNPAIPVIRHGDKVKYIPYNDITNQISEITKSITEYKKKGYNSIAVICKDEDEASDLNRELAKNNIVAKNITNADIEYEGGTCTITSYLAKGLEFDGAIIADASERKYESNKIIDMKLLYVAMTRPLHELRVLYNGDIVEPLGQDNK